MVGRMRRAQQEEISSLTLSQVKRVELARSSLLGNLRWT